MSGAPAPTGFNDCVSREELTNILNRKHITQLRMHQDTQTSNDNLTTRVCNLEQWDEEPISGDEEDDDANNVGHGRDDECD